MLKNGVVRLMIAALAFVSAATVWGQSFSGFTAGNLVVSRTVYTGSPATLAAGQPIPPVCPAAAACGKTVASDNGAYPSLTSSNNVWNNNNIDGSFGVTSPIFLDQITGTGTLVNSLPIPTSMVTTSFSSKSEMALNVSPDGTALTFMAYVAPPNTIDVSNSNTPLVYDPTNPAGGSYYRSVVQVGANGAIQVTPTNSYSGNNGRAAVLANGIYYMAGNGNNGAGTPANVVATEGVQMAIPGQSMATPALSIGNFSVSQVINPATGLPYPPDKAGKDNNFRGLTIFGNTLYVTKGSGSNGFNTVYQVGDKGSLPTLANAASAALTILPGFPNTLAKASGAQFPFGLFFANATTLYVADEGDGTTANAATSTTAGLQKWILSKGVWTRAYVLQNGLNLGQPYTVTNYPTALNPATDGLRNIAGKVNSDGTVTIWAITSTVSANGDQGADPNKLVTITDVVANTSAAASEQFTTLRTANAGEVLRGVSLTPVAGSTPAVNVPLILSMNNPSATAIAPGSLAIAAGQFPTSPTPTVSILDAAGNTTPATFAAATSSSITFMVPSTVAVGTAQITVTSGSATQTASNVQIATVSPTIFTANGAGLASAQAIQVGANAAQTTQQVYHTDGNGAVIANPIVLSSSTNTYLVLYGTGIAAAGTALTSATINGVAATVLYAGPAGAGSGLDQVNILIPAKLAGAGNVNVQVTAEAIAANPVQVTIQ
ncbi:Glycerophosphoryl diester phosphodiesterase (modular protein) [Candidatus Sulfopaludibacter sp. SbA3]|nr:Glycerophosphoryl diester phosphodiesterase (modular protein) [Candidatus Sulfopaludibacter sp. SbA3]